ncbi:MAG: hypothetical protein IK135_02365 [Bacteroidales bacterium]|nr:hypothetical protein [Bacteroidales bacterium]
MPVRWRDAETGWPRHSRPWPSTLLLKGTGGISIRAQAWGAAMLFASMDCT